MKAAAAPAAADPAGWCWQYQLPLLAWVGWLAQTAAAHRLSLAASSRSFGEDGWSRWRGAIEEPAQRGAPAARPHRRDAPVVLLHGGLQMHAGRTASRRG